MEHQASLSLTSALVRHILEERSHGDVSALPTPSTKPELRQVKQRKLARAASALYSRLPAKLQYAVELASEKGASTWLTARPLAEHGFAISKLSFRDGLCLRYGWPIDHLPSHCVCGREFSPEHALSCPTGGLPTVRHNELRDLLGSLLSEVCPDVALEPVLQPLSGEVSGDARQHEMTTLAWISVPMASGAVVQEVHFLMFGSSIRSHPPTISPHLLPLTAAMNWPRRTAMRSEFWRLSGRHSLH